MFSKTITLSDQTFLEFGYYPENLPKFSLKQITVSCIGCGKVLKRSKREEYRNHQCSSIINGLKHCVGCKDRLPLSDFGPNKSTFDGLQRKCRICTKKYEKLNKKHLYSLKLVNREKSLQLYLSARMASSKNRAKNKNMAFDLDLDYLMKLFEKQQGNCYYTGIPLVLKNKGCKSNSFTIDRLDPIKGYIKGNIVFCTHCINSMKSTMNEGEFKIYLKEVLPLLQKYIITV